MNLIVRTESLSSIIDQGYIQSIIYPELATFRECFCLRNSGNGNSSKSELEEGIIQDKEQISEINW